MNNDKLPFLGKLSPTVDDSNGGVVNDHDSQEIPIHRPAVSAGQQLSSAEYQLTGQDIICGRGRGSFLHEGNKVYLSLLRENINAYLVATKRVEKAIVISGMVSSLMERGFRFLRQDEKTGGWYELNNAEAYERTAHAIRDLIRKQKGRRKSRKDSKSTSRASSPTESDSSIGSEKTKKKPSILYTEVPSMDIEKSISQYPSEPLASVFSLDDNADADSFDEQIGEIPSEVMTPTDRLQESVFDIFFEVDPDDFERMLSQLDTDKQKRRHSGNGV